MGVTRRFRRAPIRHEVDMLDKLDTYTGMSCSVMDSRARCAIFSTS